MYNNLRKTKIFKHNLLMDLKYKMRYNNLVRLANNGLELNNSYKVTHQEARLNCRCPECWFTFNQPKNSELFEDVLTGAFMDAAFSSENFFASFIKSLKKAITQLLIQLAVITAIKLLLGDASTVKDAFNLAKLSVLGLEKGGIVTGPTLSMIGEGKESEAVLPLSKLDNMLSNNSGNQKVEVFGRISGNDIFLSNSKSANSRLRSV